MIEKVQSAGYVVHGKTFGEVWLAMVKTILKNGNPFRPKR